MKGSLSLELKQIETIIIQGRYNEAHQKLDQYLEKKDFSPEDYIRCKILKTRIYYLTQPYSLGIESAQEALQKSQALGSQYLIFDSAIWLQHIFVITGEIDEAFKTLEIVKQAFDSLEEVESFDYLKRKSFYLRSRRPYRDGFDAIQEDLNESLEISEKINDDYGKTWALFLLGNLHSFFDKKSEALLFFNQCYVLAERTDDIESKMGSQHNSADIHIMQGDIEEGFNLQKNALTLAREMNSPFIVGIILGDIGSYYWHKSDLESTYSYYNLSLSSLEEAKNTNHWHYSLTLFNLALISLEMGDIKKALKFQDKIESIKTTHDEHHVSKRFFELTKAIVLKYQLFHGEEIGEATQSEIEKSLEKISFSKFVFGDINKIALFHLCDFYVHNYQTSKDELTFEKLKTAISRFAQKAKEQKSLKLLAEVYLFESQIALIDFDTGKARTLLNEAQKIAEEKGIFKLANLVSNSYDNLLDNLHYWESTTLQLPAISDRLELTHIEDLLNKFVRNKIIYTDIAQEEEQPVVFFIINLDGSILFSEIFSDELLSDETVNGILSTINSIDKSPDDESKTIERLKFETHSILFSNFKNFSFSYVFYGQSYLAMKKFQKMLNKLEDSEQFLDEINELCDEPTLEKRINLVEYINNVFLE
ncbi:MAG: tetratricopeptide repeat protein [Candidatus Heimdallarchaeaceae archaeon]